MKLRSLAFAVVALVGCSSRERTVAPTESQPPAALLARVRRVDRAFAGFGRSHATSRMISLPMRADGWARIGLDASRTLSIRAVDVASVPPQRIEGATVFAAARPALDVLFAQAGDRFEEVRVLHDERAPATARWSIEAADGVVDLRVQRSTVEALDADGHVVVRTEPLFAVDARGVRREPRLTLEKAARGWTLAATLDRTGLAYPIVLDPIWLYGGSTSATHTSAFAVRLADGKVYVLGGGTTFESFDPKTASFTTLASFPMDSSITAMFATSAGLVRAIADAVYTYDPKTGTWSTGATLPSTHYSSTMVQLADGKILAIGGWAASSPSNAVDAWDPGTNTWASRATMTTARTSTSAVALPSGKVLIVGGTDSGGTYLSTTEVYDPSTDSFTAGPTLSFAASSVMSAVLPSGKVALIGGRDLTGSNTKTALYDPSSNTATDGPTLASSHTDGAVAQLDSRLFVIGGSLGSEDATGMVEVSNGFPAAFTKTASLLVPRVNPAAVPLLDGRLLVVGGYGGMLGGPVSISEMLSSYPDGQKCVFGAECASGFCASGVCCATACTGACERCNLAGSEGTCKPAPAKTACGDATSCTGSMLTTPGLCDGAATTCPGAGASPCPGGLTCADAVSCRTSCTKNDDCTTGACDTATGLCVPADAGATDAGALDDAGSAAPVPEGAPKVAGSAQRCTRADECSTGFCVDGVCCDSACTDRCHSCALPSAPGRCTESPVGVDLRAECGPALSCSGTCGKGGVCTDNTTNSQCAPSVCTGATTGKGAAYCKGRGISCTPDEAVPFDCGEYICDPAFGACRTSCTGSDGCAPGYLCNLDAKRCEPLPAEDDSGCAVSHVGRAGQGLTGLALLLGLLLRTRRGSRSASR